MAKIRKAEAQRAANFLHASLTILSFPDLHLPFVPFESLVAAVLPLIRHLGTDALFSFDPYETTQSFDHPDHNVAGLVAKHVGAAADVKHFLPSSPALNRRPELYLWTSDSSKATVAPTITSKIKEKRNKYLIDHYPSQFQAAKKGEWTEIFSGIAEGYVKVR